MSLTQKSAYGIRQVYAIDFVYFCLWAYMVVLVDVQHFVQCRSDRLSCSSQICHQVQIRTRAAQEENARTTDSSEIIQAFF